MYISLSKREELSFRKKICKALDARCRIIFQGERRHSCRSGWLSASPQPANIMCQHWHFFSYLTGEKEIYLFLICISLMVKLNIFFMCLLAIYISSPMNWPLGFGKEGWVSKGWLEKRCPLLITRSPGARSCQGGNHEPPGTARQLPRRLLSKPERSFLHSQPSAYIPYVSFVMKYFGFLRRALYIPLKPLIIILSRPACLFSLGFALRVPSVHSAWL